MAVHVGDVIAGLRVNDAATLDALRDALGGLVVPGVAAAPSVSVLLGADEGPVRGLHFVYVGRARVLRAKSPGRAVRAALEHLGALVAAPPAGLALHGRLLVGASGAVVVAESLGGTVDVAERPLQRRGWRVVDRPGSTLDPATLELVTPPIHPDLADALAAVEARWPDDGVAAPERAPLLALVVAGDADAGESPAEAFRSLLPLVTGRAGPTRGADLEKLARVVGAVPVLRTRATTAAAFARVLDRIPPGRATPRATTR